MAAAAADVIGSDPPSVPLAAPAQPEMGDLATPIAMALAKSARRPPREIAEAIAAALREDPPPPPGSRASRWPAPGSST